MDLKKLEEKDWLKYRKMREEVTHTTKYYAEIILMTLAGIAVIGFLTYFSIYISPSVVSIRSISNYSTTTLMKTLTNLNLTVNNTNKSTALLTTKLSNNPIALAQYAVANTTYVNWIVATLESVLFTVGSAGSVIYAYFLIMYSDRRSIPVSYRGLQRMLQEEKHDDNKLLAAGYTDAEIKWYREIRKSLVYLMAFGG